MPVSALYLQPSPRSRHSATLRTEHASVQSHIHPMFSSNLTSNPRPSASHSPILTSLHVLVHSHGTPWSGSPVAPPFSPRSEHPRALPSHGPHLQTPRSWSYTAARPVSAHSSPFPVHWQYASVSSSPSYVLAQRQYASRSSTSDWTPETGSVSMVIDTHLQ